MQQSYISPVLQARINATNTNNIIKPEEKNTVQSEKPKIKKSIVGATAAAAVASLVIGGIICFKGKNSKIAQNIINKFEELQENTADIFSSAKARVEEISSEVKDIYDNSNKIKTKINSVFSNESIEKNYKEVMSMLQEGAKTDFKDVIGESGDVIRSFKTKKFFGNVDFAKSMNE